MKQVEMDAMGLQQDAQDLIRALGGDPARFRRVVEALAAAEDKVGARRDVRSLLRLLRDRLEDERADGRRHSFRTGGLP